MVSSQDHIFKVKQQICLYDFLVCGVGMHAVPVKRETLPLLAEDGSLQGAGVNAANQTVGEGGVERVGSAECVGQATFFSSNLNLIQQYSATCSC